MKKKTKKSSTQKVTIEVVTQPQPTTAIVPVQEQIVTQSSVELQLEAAEKSMYKRNQLLKLIAKQINPRDIFVYVRGTTCKKCGGNAKPAFNGTGYFCRNCRNIPDTGVEEDVETRLSGNGCRFVLSSAGAKFEDPSIIEKTYPGTEGPYIDFEVWVTVVTGDGRCVRTMGNNPSNDDFFAKRSRWICEKCNALTSYGKEGPVCPVHGKTKAKRESYYLTMQEVDLPSVKQKAMTNAWNHAVCDLGLMPTVRHFEEVGLDLRKCKRISYGRSSEENDEEFAAAPPPSNAAPQSGEPAGRSRAGQPAGDTTKKAPSAPSTTSNAANSAGGASRSQASTSKEAQKDDRPLKSAVPAAQIPFSIQSVKWTKSGSGIEVTLDTGKKLYAFDNRKMGEDGEKLLDLLLTGVGKIAIFVTKENETKDKRKFTNIVALLKLGSREWLEDGTPVIRREREPGDEPLEDVPTEDSSTGGW